MVVPGVFVFVVAAGAAADVSVCKRDTKHAPECQEEQRAGARGSCLLDQVEGLLDVLGTSESEEVGAPLAGICEGHAWSGFHVLGGSVKGTITI